LALAESAMRRLQLEDAHRFAGRALTQLKTGSPGWLRAKDIAAQVALQLKKR
jgi:predicted Zn-dependent protease